MKKLIYAMGIATIAMVSCKKEAPVDYAVISGKITNLEENEVTINSKDGSFKDTIKVMPDGSFVDTLRVKTGTYRFFAGKNYTKVHLDTGNNIAINFDADNFDNTLTFSGQGSETSSYLLAKEKKEKELMGEGFTFYELEESIYKTKTKEIKDSLEEMISSALGISDSYKTKEKRNINYEYLNRLKTYGPYHSYIAKKPEFKPSEGFLDELNKVTYDNEEDFIFSDAYKGLVEAHFEEQSRELAQTDSISRGIAYLKTVGSIPNNVIKNELLFDKAKHSITYTDELETYYRSFQEVSTNEAHKKEITKSYNTLKKVAKGQPSPKFVGYENYAGGTASLDDFKGKYVYITQVSYNLNAVIHLII